MSLKRLIAAGLAVVMAFPNAVFAESSQDSSGRHIISPFAKTNIIEAEDYSNYRNDYGRGSVKDSANASGGKYVYNIIRTDYVEYDLYAPAAGEYDMSVWAARENSYAQTKGAFWVYLNGSSEPEGDGLNVEGGYTQQNIVFYESTQKVRLSLKQGDNHIKVLVSEKARGIFPAIDYFTLTPVAEEYTGQRDYTLSALFTDDSGNYITQIEPGSRVKAEVTANGGDAKVIAGFYVDGALKNIVQKTIKDGNSAVLEPCNDICSDVSAVRIWGVEDFDSYAPLTDEIKIETAQTPDSEDVGLTEKNGFIKWGIEKNRLAAEVAVNSAYAGRKIAFLVKDSDGKVYAYETAVLDGSATASTVISLEADTGEYTLCAVIEGAAQLCGDDFAATFNYIDNSKYEKAVKEILAAETAAELDALLTDAENIKILDIAAANEYYASAGNKEWVAEKLIEHFDGKTLDDYNNREFADELREQLILYSLLSLTQGSSAKALKNAIESESFTDYIAIDRLSAYTDYYKNYQDDVKLGICGRLIGKVVNDDTEFTDAFYEAVMLGGIEYAVSWADVQKLVVENQDYFDVDTSSVTNGMAVYAPLIGRHFETAKEAAEAIGAALDNQPEYSGSTPSSKGSNGSKVGIGVLDNAAEEQETEVTFLDMDGWEWAKIPVAVLVKKGILNGMSNTEFVPGAEIRREEFVKCLVMMFGLYDENTRADFADVPAEHWSSAYIGSAQKYGLVKGGSDKIFGLGEGLPREEMAGLLYEFMTAFGVNIGEEGSSGKFADMSQIDEKYLAAVQALKAGGVINGGGDNRFNPKSISNRAETAVVLYQMLQRIQSRETAIAEDTDNKNTETVFETEHAVLTALGICHDEFNKALAENPSAPVSKAEFARLFIQAMNITPGAMQDKTYFYDVTAQTSNAAYINCGASRGYITGDDMQKFYPESDITFVEAGVMLLAALGYNDYFAAENKKPRQSPEFPAAIGLYKGINVGDYNRAVTYDEAVRMLFNTLSSSRIEVSDFSGGSTEYEYQEDNLFYELFKVYKNKGLVTGNSLTTLTEPDRHGKGYIQLDGEWYKNDMIGADELLGYTVDYYFIEDDFDNRVIYMSPNNRSRELKIAAQDIVSFDNRRYTYTEGKRNKTAALDSDFYHIYNNIAVTDGYADYRYIPESGYIRLIDCDGDGRYEVLLVYGYQNRIVKSISTELESMSFYSESGDTLKSLSLQNKDYYVKTLEGADTGLSAIGVNTAVYILEAIKENEIIYFIYQGTAPVSGTVDSVSDDELTMVSDGVASTYELNKNGYKLSEITPGVTGSFYTDVTGRIFGYMVKTSGNMSVGFLIKALYVEEDERLALKILTTTGEMKIFVCDERFTLSGPFDESGDKTKRVNLRSDDHDEAYNCLLSYYGLSQDNAIVRDVVLYRLTEEGNISRLELACAPYTGSLSKLHKGDGFHYIIEEYSTWYFTSNPRCFTVNATSTKAIEDVKLMSDGAQFFTIPKEHGKDADEEVYRAESMGFGNDTSHMVRTYSTTGDSEFADVVVECADFNDLPSTASLYAVNKVRTEEVDGDIVTALELCTNSDKTTTYYCDDSEKVDGVKRGDLVRINSTPNNFITVLEVVARYDKELERPVPGPNYQRDDGDGKELMKLGVSNTYYLGAPTRYMLGKVYNNVNNILFLVRPDELTTEKRTETDALDVSRFYTFMVYDSDNGQWRKGTASDIYDYVSYGADASTVFAHLRYASGVALYIYN